MRSNKLLTISIAAYNVESSLERALTSIACKSDLFRMLDIIIVDDGSTDRTPEIAEEFVSRYPGSARLIRKSNGGYGSTVNTALRAAEGKYFKLLDGDDAFDTEGLESLLRYLGSFPSEDGEEKNSPDIVITPFIFYLKGQSGRSDMHRTILSDRHPGMQETLVNIVSADLSDGLMMFELCVKTSILKRSGVSLTENCFYTDNEFVMTAELYAETAVRFPYPVYIYSVGDEQQSMSVKGRRLHCEDKIKAAHGVFSIYDDYTKGSSEGVSASLTSQTADTRQFITDKLLSTMSREVYVSMMIQESPDRFRDRLRDYDDGIRKKWPYAYAVSGQSRLVSAVRKAGPLTYRILCRRILRTERERTGSIGEISTHTDNTAKDHTLLAAEYIAAACMIIQCRTVYMHLETYGMIVNRTVCAVMMAALAVCILKGNSGTPDKPSVLYNNAFIKDTAIVCLCIAVYTGVFIIADPVNPLRVIRCASAVAMMLILTRMPGGPVIGRDILGCWRDLMLIIAGVSILGWISGSILQLLPCTDYVYIDWSDTGEHVRIPTFLYIYFETQWTDWAFIHARNTGIFVEGPMAGFAYCIAILTECFIAGSSRKKHISSIVLLTFAVLSTFSLICYGFLLLTALCGIAELINRGKISKKTMTGLAAASAAAFVILIILVAEKLHKTTGMVRVNDFIVGFRAWLAHPLFGGGFENLEYLQQFMPAWRRFDSGFSNSPMEILGQGGIYLAAPYVYAFVSALFGSWKRKDIKFAAVTLLFAYLFTFIVVPYQYISFLILILLVLDGITGETQ